MSLATGTRLGPYETTSKLGEGGMGEVYRERKAFSEGKAKVLDFGSAKAMDATASAANGGRSRTLAEGIPGIGASLAKRKP